jgi:hypothetical protein
LSVGVAFRDVKAVAQQRHHKLTQQPPAPAAAQPRRHMLPQQKRAERGKQYSIVVKQRESSAELFFVFPLVNGFLFIFMLL